MNVAYTLTEEQKAKHFAGELRRILILQKMMLYCVQGMKHGNYLPKSFTQAMTGFSNSIYANQQFIRKQTTKETWAEIAADLENDKLHDISCLIDEVVDIQNIDDIIEVISKSKITAYGKDDKRTEQESTQD